jgi:hypothetical protein
MVATPTPDTAITWSNTPPSMLATASPVVASPSCRLGSEPSWAPRSGISFEFAADRGRVQSSLHPEPAITGAP